MDPNSTLDARVAQESDESEHSLADRVLFKQTVSGFRYQQRAVKAEFLIETEEHDLLFSLFLRYEDNDAPLVMKQGKEVNYAGAPPVIFIYDAVQRYAKQHNLSVAVPSKFIEASRKRDMISQERDNIYSHAKKEKYAARLRKLTQQISRYNKMLSCMYVQAVAEQYGGELVESYTKKITLFLSQRGPGSIAEIVAALFASTTPYRDTIAVTPLRNYSDHRKYRKS